MARHIETCLDAGTARVRSRVLPLDPAGEEGGPELGGGRVGHGIPLPSGVHKLFIASSPIIHYV
jgi:hypothetical protein